MKIMSSKVIFLFLCIIALACSPKNKDKNQTNSQVVDTSNSFPEALPQALKDERFLNLVKEIKPAKFVVYANEVERNFRTKIAPQIEDEKDFAGFLSNKLTQEMGLPQVEFGKENWVWIQNKWVQKNFVLLLVGTSPKGMLREQVDFYLLTFQFNGKFIDYIPWAHFAEISPTTEKKSFSLWNEYEIKAHFEEVKHSTEQKRYIKTVITYELSEKGKFEQASFVKRESLEKTEDINLGEEEVISELYKQFPFQPDGFALSSPNLKVKEYKANAFLELEQSDDMSPPRIVYFTYFTDKEGKKTFAYQYFAQGTVAASEHDIQFFRVEGKMWRNVTDEICPLLSFRDFWGNSAEMPELKIRNCFQIKYQLPQKGTTIIATLEEIPLIDSEIEPEFFEKIKKQIRYKAIELNWNMDKATFEIGEKR